MQKLDNKKPYLHNNVSLFEYIIFIINIISQVLLPIVLRSEILILITARQLHPITDPVPENNLYAGIKISLYLLDKRANADEQENSHQEAVQLPGEA